MHRLESALVGLLVIAAVAAAPAAAEGPAAHEPPVATSRQPADGRGTGFLRPVTAGMRSLLSARPQVETEQIALAIPNVSRSDRPSMLGAIVIDVLVAYTGKAAKNYRDIVHQLINPAIDGTNGAFRLSNLDHIRLRLVHTYQTDYVEEGAHFDHVWRFADKGDGYMDEVHALRDMYRADIAILIVDDPSGCGLATRVRADADDAFAVVHHACAVANYTLAHEVGHLIGASHDLSYSSTRRWRDIMAAKDSCGGCPRLPVWSNPTVLINGEPAGTVELNNARVIAEQAARIAAFR
jgi:hypothetical protein